MKILAGIILVVPIILIITSFWRLNWLTILLTFVGLAMFEYGIYIKSSYPDYLSYALYVGCILFLTYFVEAHRILGTSVTNFFTRESFREYLEKNGLYHGYGQFIYKLPITVIVGMVIFVFSYFLVTDNQQLKDLVHFFSNWSDYPGTMD